VAAIENIAHEVKGKELTLKSDLSTDLGPSASGKTRLVAKGRVEVQPGVFAQLTVYRKR
jgi:hypothetical protein